MSTSTTDNTQKVIEHYSALAREDVTQNAAHIKKVAESFGYDPEDLAAIPDGANLGVSCGNPLAIAGLKAGETVVDLGSGAGFDVFQAARKVGQTGLAIGIDMSDDMLARANTNATKSSITNVKFIKSPINKLPLESSTVDCVISNCVINLLPHEEKPVCFAEVFRVLKPGGRFSVSDILAKREMPEIMISDLSLYVGCISGASLYTQYEQWLKHAGFEDVLLVDKKSDLNIYKERLDTGEAFVCQSGPATKSDDTIPVSSCCGSKNAEKPAAKSSCCGGGKSAQLPAGEVCCGSSTNGSATETEKKATLERIANLDLNEYVSSFSVYAVKPIKNA
jgi:SAM-dependent methyltransferase